jgi:transcriptional regulator with XRE-family HTH domain
MNRKVSIDNIKEQIKRRMEAKNLSTYSLEKQAGLGRGIIGNIVYDKSKAPRIDTLQAIAEALDCGIDDLLLGESQHDSNPKIDHYRFIEPLFLDVVNDVTLRLKNKKATLPLEKVLFFIQESYIYCMTKKNEQLDKEFIEWYIDTNTQDD